MCLVLYLKNLNIYCIFPSHPVYPACCPLSLWGPCVSSLEISKGSEGVCFQSCSSDGQRQPSPAWRQGRRPWRESRSLKMIRGAEGLQVLSCC